MAGGIADDIERALEEASSTSQETVPETGDDQENAQQQEETQEEEPKDTETEGEGEETPEGDDSEQKDGDDEEESEEEPDGSEGSEEEEDGEATEEARVPESRLKEVVAAKNEAIKEARGLEQEVSRLKETESQLESIKQDLADMKAVAEFDPRMKELLNHWFFSGKPPDPDSIEDMGKFQEFMQSRAQRDAERTFAEKQREEKLKESTEEKFAKIQEEEKTLKDDPVVAELMKADPDVIQDAYEFLGDVVEAAQKSGKEPRITSLKDAVKAVRAQEVVEIAAKIRHRDSLKKATQPKKILKNRGAASKKPSGKPVDPANLPLHEHTRRVIEEMAAS